jgi:hypothetical protein
VAAWSPRTTAGDAGDWVGFHRKLKVSDYEPYGADVSGFAKGAWLKGLNLAIELVAAG